MVFFLICYRCWSAHILAKNEWRWLKASTHTFSLSLVLRIYKNKGRAVSHLNIIANIVGSLWKSNQITFCFLSKYFSYTLKHSQFVKDFLTKLICHEIPVHFSFHRRQYYPALLSWVMSYYFLCLITHNLLDISG